VDFNPLLGVPLGELLPPAASSMPLPLPSLSALRAQIDPVDVQGGCWLSDPDAQLFLPPGRLGDALKTEVKTAFKINGGSIEDAQLELNSIAHKHIAKMQIKCIF